MSGIIRLVWVFILTPKLSLYFRTGRHITTACEGSWWRCYCLPGIACSVTSVRRHPKLRFPCYEDIYLVLGISYYSVPGEYQVQSSKFRDRAITHHTSQATMRWADGRMQCKHADCCDVWSTGMESRTVTKLITNRKNWKCQKEEKKNGTRGCKGRGIAQRRRRASTMCEVSPCASCPVYRSITQKIIMVFACDTSTRNMQGWQLPWPDEPIADL